ncbi:MAG: peptidylprolyl isomerase [Deltaproteobacteria bacterium]|jgi:parvulin-like peptidyl-prolyl isomerase|nr:peptidylprolyl isomerase [Deltaproteobacteria bacterium]
MSKSWRLLVAFLVAAGLFWLAASRFSPEDNRPAAEGAPSAPQASSPNAAPPPPLDSPMPLLPPVLENSTDNVALVNGAAISFKSFYTQLELQSNDDLDYRAFDPDGAPSLTLQLQVLDLLVKLELATQEAYRLGFAPTATDLERLTLLTAENYGGQEKLVRTLENAGETLELFQTQIARTEAVKNWRNIAFLAGALVTEQEAEDFYNQHQEDAVHGEEARALQITLPLPVALGQTDGADSNRAKIKALAENILAQAQSGIDFMELARRYMDPMTLSATNNGDMGWVSRGSGFPELENLLFSLEPGEVGGIVETPFSLHIVKVLERREPGVLSFQILKPEIIEFLTETRVDRLVQARIEELLKTANIEIIDPRLASHWNSFQANPEPFLNYEIVEDPISPEPSPPEANAPAEPEAPPERSGLPDSDDPPRSAEPPESAELPEPPALDPDLPAPSDEPAPAPPQN